MGTVRRLAQRVRVEAKCHVLRFGNVSNLGALLVGKATIRRKKRQKIVLATVLTFAMSAAVFAQAGGARGAAGGGAGRGGAGADRGGSTGASPGSTVIPPGSNANPGTGTLNNDSPSPNGLPNNNGLGSNANNGIGDPGNLSNTNR